MDEGVFLFEAEGLDLLDFFDLEAAGFVEVFVDEGALFLDDVFTFAVAGDGSSTVATAELEPSIVGVTFRFSMGSTGTVLVFFGDGGSEITWVRDN